jgi:hypothetical protein
MKMNIHYRSKEPCDKKPQIFSTGGYRVNTGGREYHFDFEDMEATIEFADGYLNIHSSQWSLEKSLFDDYTHEELIAVLMHAKKEDFTEIFNECYGNLDETEDIPLDVVDISFSYERTEFNQVICLLDVKGSTVDLLRFDRAFEQNGTGYSIENLYPTPAELDINQSYTWRKSNWGTPWNISNCAVSKSADMFRYVFFIPWEAPHGAVLEASRRHSGLSLSLSYGIYTEEGKTRFEQGEAVHVE